ncbi:helix-turn-helix transcriptional regulator [Nocardia terpenica]|uniref:helix-turn-helix domain-containing protein n=1 Tax=Nocardia terpenica TaxID=455432 RepID=UPI0018959468|nr:helix-turn-helix transcriptional regulator [Nocardia terpenica]MBF6059813.1 helix-turn-helix transcriptional regulator [Nocardia terpenica]MBF6102646.1 helix-turn-helix transcriptional regulator [Nocardia terpenica]MBF6111163.1 helix-turn-helix transcriptional regulator [Nocardia terpenica]MBF6117294.1 helix-turn-helix transcriptional regulator [Nocardia terpenica]MBF6150865.1 helix-turn-helix transcriptional regulator [Nocardia terpenica]
MTSGDSVRRSDIGRVIEELRAVGRRAGLHPHEVAARIGEKLPAVSALEAQRLARGWSRRELSQRLDELYESDGLAPPGLAEETLCRWEHGDRIPSAERIDYLCRLYRTRPDRLGFGVDHSHPMQGRDVAGLVGLWPYTSQESEKDLVSRIELVGRELTMFGLTRNAYARDDILGALRDAAARGVTISMFVMDPWCDSRRDRYRVEPAEAVMEDPRRYVRECLRPLARAASAFTDWRIWTFDFPISMAVERFDDVIRVMFYVPGRRGTESPILALTPDFEAYDFFCGQLEWLHARAADPDGEPWKSRGVHVRPLLLPRVSGMGEPVL